MRSLSKFILEFLDLWVLILLIPCFYLFFVMYDSPLRTFLCFTTTLIGLILTLVIVKKFKSTDETQEMHIRHQISQEELNKAEIRKQEHNRLITDKDKY